MIDFAAQIKESVSAKDAAERYGLKIDRKGYACCPFHSEKTPSFKAYDGTGGWHCFGCGQSGDVIDFVQQYFGLSFQDAIARLNSDFCLGLPIGEKIDARQQLEAEKKAFARRREADRRKQALEAAKSAYYAAFDRYVNICSVIERKRPKNEDFPFDDDFVAAVHAKGLAEYELEQAETRLYLAEKRFTS